MDIDIGTFGAQPMEYRCAWHWTIAVVTYTPYQQIVSVRNTILMNAGKGQLIVNIDEFNRGARR